MNNYPPSHPTLGKPNNIYVYHDQNGDEVVAVYRYDNSDISDNRKKAFSQFDIKNQKWQSLKETPLFKTTELINSDDDIIIVEGEKCVNALFDIGFTATTVLGGCNGVNKANLSILIGRNIFIWPDNDEAGIKYAEKLRDSLELLGNSSIKLIKPEIKGKHKGWDAADAINEGMNKKEIHELIKSAKPFITENSYVSDFIDAPDKSILNPIKKAKPIPIEVFGDFWSEWLSIRAEGCSAPVDYVAATLLVATSALIGNSRRISPWQGWEEPPFLWFALVGNPSSGKSPAMDPVLSILSNIEKYKNRNFEEELRAYEGQVVGATIARDAWKAEVKSKPDYPPSPLPENAILPEKPQRKRLKVSDSTQEALATLLPKNPKGVLVQRDELAGWLGSFDRYKSGGNGGDRAFWLEAFGGRSYIIDRVKNNGDELSIPYLGVSIIGGIQPDKLVSLLLKGDDDGLTARFLYAWPDPIPQLRPKRFNKNYESYDALEWIDKLEMRKTDEGLEPITIMLTDDASYLFADWREIHSKNQVEGSLAGWWGKMGGYCLRLALTLEFLWASAGNKQEPSCISIEAIEAAIKLIDDYFKPMAERAFSDARLPKVQKNAATLAKWIMKNRPEEINSRDIQRNAGLNGLKNAHEIHAAIEFLIDANWLQPNFTRQGDNKGRKSNNYLVNPQLWE